MLFRKNIEKNIIVQEHTTLEIIDYRKQLPNLETGGIILGKILQDEHILVTELSKPSKLDKRGYYSFESNKENVQKIINDRWKDSDGKVIYLGEWHTHNEDIPNPSPRDLEMIKNQLETSKMEINFLLLLIIGQESDYWGIQTKRGHKKIKISNNPFC